MAIGTFCSFYKDLQKLIKLPDECISLDIHMAGDELVTVECKYYANIQPAEAFDGRTKEIITHKYNLTLIDEENAEIKT